MRTTNIQTYSSVCQYSSLDLWADVRFDDTTTVELLNSNGRLPESSVASHLACCISKSGTISLDITVDFSFFRHDSSEPKTPVRKLHLPLVKIITGQNGDHTAGWTSLNLYYHTKSNHVLAFLSMLSLTPHPEIIRFREFIWREVPDQTPFPRYPHVTRGVPPAR
jgi:hypothetical protein